MSPAVRSSLIVSGGYGALYAVLMTAGLLNWIGPSEGLISFQINPITFIVASLVFINNNTNEGDPLTQAWLFLGGGVASVLLALVGCWVTILLRRLHPYLLVFPAAFCAYWGYLMARVVWTAVTMPV
jgi:hypothetical protein